MGKRDGSPLDPLDMTAQKKARTRELAAPTLEQIRLKVRELRREASRLFQVGEIERASTLLKHAVQLEDVIAILAR